MDFQFRRRFFVRDAFAVEITHPHDLIESLRAHRARVHPQTAADLARIPSIHSNPPMPAALPA